MTRDTLYHKKILILSPVEMGSNFSKVKGRLGGVVTEFLYTRIPDFKQSTLFLKDSTKILSPANVIQNSTS